MKKKSKKMPIIIAIVAIVVIIVVAAVIIGLNSGHRVIKVESFEGAVALVRGSKEAELVDGMNLKSKDIITTGADGLIELLVDEDKHILAQENTKFAITASGNEKKGMLQIELAYGTSLIEIENKLEEGSEVEVTTPNASLSVRGTTFEANYNEDENVTVVKVTEGVVNVASDTESEEVTAGQMAIVKDDEVEIEDLSIAYRDVSAFEARYSAGHAYSGIFVKELVGWEYEEVEQTSAVPDVFTKNGVKIRYWVLTEDEVNSQIDMSGETGHLQDLDYLKNDSGDTIICASYDFNGTVENLEIAYEYYKKIEDDKYLSIMVLDEDGGNSLGDADINTYLPLTNDEYYIYDN